MLSPRVRKVAAKYSVGVNFITTWPYFHEQSMFEDQVETSSCLWTSVEIGLYYDVYQEEISFFHELGHIFHGWLGNPRRVLKWQIELAAWQKGLEIAKEQGYYFPSDALEWADTQLLTYVGYEEREIMDYVRPRTAPKFPLFPVQKHWEWVCKKYIPRKNPVRKDFILARENRKRWVEWEKENFSKKVDRSVATT